MNEELDRLDELQAEYKKNPSPDLRQAIHEELKERSEFTFDMDNTMPVTHHWVDRGAVLSCEGAGHPNHRHFKRVQIVRGAGKHQPHAGCTPDTHVCSRTKN